MTDRVLAGLEPSVSAIASSSKPVSVMKLTNTIVRSWTATSPNLQSDGWPYVCSASCNVARGGPR